MCKTPLLECNLRWKTTWVPTHAPNLIHVPCMQITPGTWPLQVSRLFPRGSLIVAHPTASCTPHAWTLYDFDFSLTECWNVAWKPPFSAQLYCLGCRGPRPPCPAPWCRPSSATLTRKLPETLASPPSLPLDPAFGAPSWLWSTPKSEGWSVHLR